MPRRLNSWAIDLRVVAPSERIARRTGASLKAKSSALSINAARPDKAASAKFRGLPRMAPEAFFAAKAALVRSDISRRSFSASAA
jgi:hypothetical protein